MICHGLDMPIQAEQNEGFNMHLPTVSYIIVTMNRQEKLVECLTSVREQEYPDKQIIVVDNGSSDKTVNLIREQLPDVELLALSSNQGVAGGRNRGVEITRGKICIFLDDDAYFIDPQATYRAVSYFQENPQLACVAFLIRNSCTDLEDMKAIPRIDKRSIPEDYLCSYFCGAGFAIRQKVFGDIGMFWERLDYGGEDLDLSYRLLDNRYRLLRTASIEVVHRETLQARPEGRWIYANTRNRCWIAVKNLPWIYVISTILLWWIYTGLISLKQKQFSFFVRGVQDAIKGLPSVLRERRTISTAALQELKRLSGRRWY
jgi:GT2 family glycosyltransferase